MGREGRFLVFVVIGMYVILLIGGFLGLPRAPAVLMCLIFVAAAVMYRPVIEDLLTKLFVRDNESE